MARGRFISLEGGEGCGKTTQARRLCEALAAEGFGTVLTREPGGTHLAELIRSLLKDEEKDPPCDRAELLLFLAARAQLVENVVRPAIEAGKWVVSDRFSDSTFAYQGYGRGLPLDVLRIANDFACGSLKPDLTLLLEAPPEIAAARMRRREESANTGPDRIERAGEGFHARLREGFERLADEEPDRIVRIDASGSPDEVWERVWKSVKRFL